MKRICSIAVLLVAFTMSSLALCAQKQHPYLYFTKDRIAATKEKVRKDTIFQHAWEMMKAKADADATAGKGGDMVAQSLAYRMTGDTKYAKHAKMLLEKLLSSNQWDGLDDRTPRWNSALGTAHKNGMAAITFDAIYDILSQQEKKKMAERIVKLGIEPSLEDWLSADKRLHTINSMGHNWWSAIVFQAGVASLAVMNEIPQAKGWAQEVLSGAEEWFTFSGSVLENKVPNFDPQGGFYESINYANFGIGEYLFFRIAWTNVFGKISRSYDHLLKGSANWFVDMSYPRTGQLYSLNFGDGSYTTNGERVIKLMMALGFSDANYIWYLQQAGKGSFREDLSVNNPLGLVFSPSLPKEAASNNRPTASLYSTMGWASLRSSWKEDATLFGIKSGYTWNHAHADAGSFMLWHKGKTLLIDAGNVNYGNPAYSAFSVRSDAHNVMLFNGKAQEPQDQYYAVKNVGYLYNLMDVGSFKYILADAQPPTARYFLRNYRNVIWVGSVILILDDVKSYESGKFEWLLHPTVPVKKKGIDLEVTDDKASVLVRPLFPETLPNGYPHDFPEKMKLEERVGVKDHDPNTKQTYYSISPAEASRQTKFITAILLLDDKNKPVEDPALSGMASAKEMRTGLPKIEKLEGENYIGVRISENGITNDIYFNLMADGRIMHRNSHNVISGWETDAYLFGIAYKEGSNDSDPANITRYFVSNRSYIRKNQKPILNSLSKVFMVADKKGNELDVILQGQPIMNVGLNLKASKIMLNGKPTPLPSKDGMLQIKIHQP